MKLVRQNSSFELTLSLFALIVLILGISTWVAIPEAKTYMNLQDDVRAAVKESGSLQMKYDRLYEMKEQLETEETALSERLENGTDSAELGEWIVSAWKGAVPVPGAKSGTVIVTAPLEGPKLFYRFIDRLETAPWLLVVGPSVRFFRDAGQLRVRFTLQIAEATSLLPQN